MQTPEKAGESPVEPGLRLRALRQAADLEPGWCGAPGVGSGCCRRGGGAWAGMPAPEPAPQSFPTCVDSVLFLEAFGEVAGVVLTEVQHRCQDWHFPCVVALRDTIAVLSHGGDKRLTWAVTRFIVTARRVTSEQKRVRSLQ